MFENINFYFSQEINEHKFRLNFLNLSIWAISQDHVTRCQETPLQKLRFSWFQNPLEKKKIQNYGIISF